MTGARVLRIRLGSSWKEDPSLRAAFARGRAAARLAAAEAVDALALEVDGVDVAAGRAEGVVLAGVSALCQAVLRLLGGAPRAEVHFSEGGLELILARRGGAALLTVVALDRPARVLARDVEVELAELGRATHDAALALCDDLGALGASATGLVRELRQLAARLEGARASPEPSPAAAAVTAHPRTPRRRGAPTCAFELRDDEGLLSTYRGPGPDLGSLLVPGKVVLRGADGREVATLDGPPFLVLRDLAAFAGRLADAVRRGDASAPLSLAGRGRHGTIGLQADLARGTLARAGGPLHPAPPLLLARALLEAAVDFCGVAAGRNPWQAQNGWVAELRAVAAERLAHVQELNEGDRVAPSAEAPVRVRARRPRRISRAPLGPGVVRRLAFRQLFRGDVGSPAGFGLALEGGLVLAAGATSVLALDSRTGAERWRRTGARQGWVEGGVLHLADGARLAAVDCASGRERWSRPLDGLPEGSTAVVRLAGGLALWVGRDTVAALDGSGRVSWTLAPPAGRALRAAAAGPLAVVGSAAGFLYGVEAASGRAAWRVRLPGPLASAPGIHGDALLALCITDLGGALLALDPATGRRRFEVPLDATPTGPLVPFAGLLGVPGVVAGDPVVAAVDPAGALAWEDAPPLGSGPAVLAPTPSGLLVKTVAGTSLALDRAGAALWTRTREPAHPPEVNVAPLVARGVALVAGEGVEALELTTGRPLGHARLGVPAHLAASTGLDLWALDAEGALFAARLATHLSLVP